MRWIEGTRGREAPVGTRGSVEWNGSLRAESRNTRSVDGKEEGRANAKNNGSTPSVKMNENPKVMLMYTRERGKVERGDRGRWRPREEA